MATIEKRILVSDRVRHPPSEGFSWVDRRFLRDFAAKLSGNGVFLYLFLSAVSDKYGLSYYGRQYNFGATADARKDGRRRS